MCDQLRPGFFLIESLKNDDDLHTNNDNNKGNHMIDNFRIDL